MTLSTLFELIGTTGFWTSRDLHRASKLSEHALDGTDHMMTQRQYQCYNDLHRLIFGSGKLLIGNFTRLMLTSALDLLLNEDAFRQLHMHANIRPVHQLRRCDIPCDADQLICLMPAEMLLGGEEVD